MFSLIIVVTQLFRFTDSPIVIAPAACGVGCIVGIVVICLLFIGAVVVFVVVYIVKKSECDSALLTDL